MDHVRAIARIRRLAPFAGRPEVDALLLEAADVSASNDTGPITELFDLMTRRGDAAAWRLMCRALPDDWHDADHAYGGMAAGRTFEPADEARARHILGLLADEPDPRISEAARDLLDELAPVNAQPAKRTEPNPRTT